MCAIVAHDMQAAPNAELNNELYAAHIEELQHRYARALEHARLDAVVIAAGRPAPIFLDDQHLPFKPNPHFAQWAPVLQHPDSILTLRPGQTPELLIYAPDDYWHRTAPIPDFVAAAPLTIREVDSGTALLEHVRTLPRHTAYIGEARNRDDSLGLRRVNPRELLDELHNGRTVKTPWEIACMRAASAVAVHGHLAAEAAFNSGASEYEIQLAFRSSCVVTDDELPYPAIVALNEHAATLHYQHLDREHVENRNLLIDAGVAIHGYASDISRSYSADPEFGAVIEAMHELQHKLCAAARPGTDFRELHIAAHHSIAALLRDLDIIDMSPEAAVDSKVSRSFFPHGLGHFLGLQVHDVGALLSSAADHNASSAPETDPYLRLTRILEVGNVLTIEPGLYFIDSLLDKLRSQPEATHVNWGRVDELRCFGGIRIEDNLHVTNAGSENLTRNAFAAAENASG